MTDSRYVSPLDQLLHLGDIRDTEAWPDYLALGIRPEHTPDLIRMAIDPELNDGPSDSAEVWAPVHTWRSLGLLQAAEAAAPLTGLFRRIDDNDDEAVGAELPQAFGLLGPAAVPVLTDYLLDRAHGLWARVAAAHSLAAIGSRQAEARGRCIDALTRALARDAAEAVSLNGFVVSFLLELNAVEAREVLERAYAAEAVDEGVVGDWEDVQVALGLKAHRDRPRQPAARPGPIEARLASFANDGHAARPPVAPSTSAAEFAARAALAVAAKQSGVPPRRSASGIGSARRAGWDHHRVRRQSGQRPRQ